jgi:radical SAM superfamily enzyme YgiQ (UPF0313 family)
MRLLLIAPTVEPERYPRGGWAFRIANYNMPLIAALTPPHVEVRVVDECAEPIPLEERFDLVGITVNTPMAPYSYRLAAHFRSRGSKVVLGGIHPSVLPGESLEHADAIAIGEAEPIWAELVSDFERGRLQRVYRAPSARLDSLPTPRWDLLRGRRYAMSRSLIAGRGCVHRCDFCSIFAATGPGYRPRPVEEVVRDVEASGRKRLMFWDDNIIADREYARRLFRALAPLGIQWVSQAVFGLAEDPALVELASHAGCRGIFLGIESLSQPSLLEARKSFNHVQQYREGIRLLHDHGIGVSAGFVFGFDHDDPGVFERTLEFAERAGIDACNFKLLTPYPGTPLFNRLDREARIIDKDWSHYRGKTHVVFRPRCMSAEDLLAGFKWVRRQCYSWGSILRRLFASRTSLEAGIPMNLGYRHIVRQEDPDPGWNPARRDAERRPGEAPAQGGMPSLDAQEAEGISEQPAAEEGER